jgi:SnoaL-like domain
MNDQPLIDKVLEYIKGCNTADIGLIMSACADDVTAYFIDMSPINGSVSLAQFWKMVHDVTKARWSVDHAIVAGQEVVIEWSQVWTPPGGSTEEFSRGVDWFIFVNGQIGEIHQYYRPRNLGPDQLYELQGFPYRDRDYPVRDDFDSHLP